VRTFVACLLLLVCSTPVFAASAADEFGAKRLPSELRLTVNTEPELCKRILTDYTALFASRAADLDIGAAISSDLPSLEMQPIETGQDTGASLGRLELDLDADGHREAIVYRIDPFREGGWHYAYVFPSWVAFEAARKQVVAEWLTTPDQQYPTPEKLELGARQYFPEALTVGNEKLATGNVWADHSLFEFSKHYYFAAGTTDFDRLIPQTGRVFRLRADGHVEVACEIQQRGGDETYQAFQRLPAVASLLEVIRKIGAGGEDGGTDHSGHEHDTQAIGTERRAATRPWATSPETRDGIGKGARYYRFDQRMMEFLEDWSLNEPWNRREYQTLLELIGPAEASYAHYLESAFGIPADTARIDSVHVIQALIGDRLLVPSQFSSDQAELYFPSTPLHRAIMVRDRAAFDAALAHPEDTPKGMVGERTRPAAEIVSEALSDAIEWPYALDRLLATGADPNHANSFGKTALMAAAHFDRVDSIRRLLQAGAKVNAVTVDVPESWMEGPKRIGRTALMYAAENAGPAVINALLDAGANPDVRDAERHGMEFYLANNPRFSDAERALGVRGLAKVADHFAGPSFDCAKAHTAAERSICGSEVLRILDEQMSLAFEKGRIRLGPSALQEQRGWLHARDQSCSGATDTDCLAELMRTHVRSLHKRLAETVAPVPAGANP
jgi:uncharacterized protein YecT (DUF1311 family)